MHDDCSSRDDQPQSVKRTVRRGLLAFGAYMLVLAVVMFWPAGGLGWVRGWAFLGTFFAVNVATVVYLWRTNPEIVVARSAPHRGTRLWDRVLFFLLNLLVLALFPVAALDNARFHWLDGSALAHRGRLRAVLLSMAGIVWVLRVNKFAEMRVRIQAERGQTVVDTGPYAVVRHPFYVLACPLFVSMPLAVGSFWALIPATLAVALRGADRFGGSNAPARAGRVQGLCRPGPLPAGSGGLVEIAGWPYARCFRHGLERQEILAMPVILKGGHSECSEESWWKCRCGPDSSLRSE